MTVRELLHRMDARELTEWIAYDRIVPGGSGRTNLLLAQLLALNANLNRDRKRRPAPYEPDRLVPFFHPYDPPAPVADKALSAGARFIAYLKGKS